MRRRVDSQKKWIAWIAGAAVALGIAALAALNIFANQPWIQNNTVLHRFTFVQEDSVKPIQSRFDIWRGTFEMIRDYPLFGIGQDTFDLAFQSYAPPALANHPTQYADRAHNLALDLLASYGLFGFAGYLGLFAALAGSVFTHLKKNRARDQKSSLAILGIFSGFVALLVAVQFNFFTLVHHAFFWTMAGMLIHFLYPQRTVLRWQLSSWQQYLLIAGFTFAVFFSILLFNILPGMEMLTDAV